MEDIIKDNGRIYTPAEIVNMMLDYAGYVPCVGIQHKHVIDNSCGDGQILCEVVRRYIESYGNGLGLFITQLNEELKKYIHGIELDETECQRCKDNLNGVLKEKGLDPIDWDIRCGNTLDLKVCGSYLNQMDYVFGNPPYVRMKNIKKSDETNDDYQILRKYSFAEKGMSDLYLAFYQLGLSMCKDREGVMCYIAPSSWINSQSGEKMRDFIKENRWLSAVIDFEHTQVFENATTYVMIALFNMRPNAFVRYDRYSEQDKTFYPEMTVSYDKMFIDGKMFFVYPERYDILKEVFKSHRKIVEVKNGYATLADDIFIDNLPEFDHYTIPVIKGSTGQPKRCFFPYDKDLNLISLDEIKKTDQKVYEYLLDHKETLQKRTYDTKGMEDTWHSIGRSQGLKDTFVKKIGVTSLVKEPKDVRLFNVDAGCGIYGGIYIKTDLYIGDLADMLIRNYDFIEYVKSLRKYKSGGYYTFSSKDLEQYLNYRLENADWKQE